MNHQAQPDNDKQVRRRRQREPARAAGPTPNTPHPGMRGWRGLPPWSRLLGRWQGLARDERGAVTAEYALVIVAAVAFAGLLIVIMRSDEVRATLVALVQDALGSGSQ